MSKIEGFMTYERSAPAVEPPAKRVSHFREFEIDTPSEETKKQANRCMDCGVPFCMSGCPLGNIIPEFNDAVYRESWHEAYTILSSTNNFPEFTGRICPAPCEASCVLGLNSDPVTIEHIEKKIAETAFEKGWVTPNVPPVRSGRSVGVIGSGPAGLAVADQLNQLGHSVVVYERDDRIGGLLRYGIPDFKLDKKVIDRRLTILQEEGIDFVTNCYVGRDISPSELREKHDAVVLCGGATIPRDLPITGRQLKGVYYAMDFLKENNQLVAGDDVERQIEVKGKNVVVIGGGDTGSDCVGTSNRLGAKSVLQIELTEKPPQKRHPSTPWPLYPIRLKTSSSHEEGCEREWSLSTLEFIGNDKDELAQIKVVDVEWSDDGSGQRSFKPKNNKKRSVPCDIVFLAIGFTHPEHSTMLKDLNTQLDNRGNVLCKDYHTSVEGVFSAGDMRRGQSLVVHAIAEGREAARSVHTFLTKDQ